MIAALILITIEVEGIIASYSVLLEAAGRPGDDYYLDTKQEEWTQETEKAANMSSNCCWKGNRGI